tara:strand:+ start:100 stop:603 length:504 start_codon:yes stop_codon:yes gene_type:complete
MDIKVYKNFLKEKEIKHLEDLMFKPNTNFPWYLSPIMCPTDKFSQLVHIFYFDDQINSSFFKELTPILDLLKPKKLIRIKANLVMKAPSIRDHGFHVDYSIPNLVTAVLYLNSNNGYTRFKDGGKIFSERNKLVKFKGTKHHTGSTCTNEEYRSVINFNYIPSSSLL